MRVLLMRAAAASGLILLSCPSQAASSLAEDAAAFGTRDGARSMDLSPSGHKLLFITPGPTRESLLRIVDLDSGDRKIILKMSAESRIARLVPLRHRYADRLRIWCHPADQGCDHRIYAAGDAWHRRIEDPTFGATSQRARSRPSSIRRQCDRLVQRSPRIDPDGSLLFATKERRHLDPGYPRRPCRGPGRPHQSRNSTGSSRRARPPQHISAIPKVMCASCLETVHAGTDGQLTGATRFKYRTSGSKDWKPLGGEMGILSSCRRRGAGRRLCAEEDGRPRCPLHDQAGR